MLYSEPGEFHFAGLDRSRSLRQPVRTTTRFWCWAVKEGNLFWYRVECIVWPWSSVPKPQQNQRAKLLPSKPSWCSYHPILWHQHRERHGCHLETKARTSGEQISRKTDVQVGQHEYGVSEGFLSENLHQRFEVEYFLPTLFWCQGLIFKQTQFQVTIRQRLGVDAVRRITGLAREDAVQQISGTIVMACHGWLPNITWTQVNNLNIPPYPSISLHIPPYPSIILEISHSWHVLSWRCQHRNQTCQNLAPRSMDSVVLGGYWVRCFHSWCSRAPGTARNRQQICDFVTPCMGGVEP